MSKVLNDREMSRVHFSLIHWFPQTNHRVQTDTLKASPGKENAEHGVFESIRERGWKEDAVILVQAFPIPYAINGVEYTADHAVADRQAKLEQWRASDETIALANAMEKVWIGEDGQFIRPLYLGIDGNRRGLSLPAILANASDSVLTNFTIPVVCRSYGDNLERVTDQISANTDRQQTGVKNLTWPDICKASKLILANGGNENTLRRLFKVGTAQKAYAIVTLSNATAEPHKRTLLERIEMPRPDKANFAYVAGGYVSAEALDKEHLRAIVKGTPRPMGEGKTDESATLPQKDRLERYIADTFVPGGRTTAVVMDKEQWKAVPAEANSPFDKIRQVHLTNGTFAALMESNPELFSARYTGSIAAPVQDLTELSDKLGKESVKMATSVKAPAKAKVKAGK